VPTPGGTRNPLVLASAHLAGVSRAFTIGGAQAIAALAYGTASVPAVDKICGPGNAYVAAAKRRVFGTVGIDMVAVPGSTSAETIAAIIADEMAIGVMNNKTTAVRIIPVPGRDVGEMVEFGGLLGSAPIMPVNRFSSEVFIRRGGRIPAPVQSLRN